MVKDLVHSPLLLGVKSTEADISDRAVASDLFDTLTSHKAECVGMAANMIGVNKRIIAFYDQDRIKIMYNPEIIKQSEPYNAKEGCLSLLGGERPCKRYRSIKVRWQNEDFKIQIKTYTGFTAEIIQHEIDHCNGILI